MAKVGKLFVEKAAKHRVVTEEQAVAIFENIKKSGRYLFNKSHSVAYAINCYRSAHAKAHFPLYFFTSYLYWAKEKQDPLKEMRQLIADAKHYDITVCVPRVSQLRSHFGTDGVDITFGLADVKGIGDKAVEKMRAALPAAEEELGPLPSWTWFEYLTHFSDHAGAQVNRRMCEVGAMRDLTDAQRQRLLAEFEAWDRLTEKEQEGVRGLGEAVPEVEPVKREERVEVIKWPSKFKKADKDEALERLGEEGCRAEFGIKLAKKMVPVVGEDGKPLTRVVGTLDPPRVVFNLEDAIEALLARPGAVTKGRREKVESILDLLREPPTALVDTPHWLAKVEEEALGIPITSSHVASADRSMVNCTVKEYHNGKRNSRRDDLTVMAVEVQDLYKRTVQNGDNRGRGMASMILADDTGTLEEVVMFPDAWEAYGHMLLRPNAVVAVGGKRSYRDETTFIVERVWEI